MIDPTDDMIDAYESARRAYWEAMDHTAEVLTVKEHGREANRAGLAAAFELVERDYSIGPVMCDQPHPSEPGAYCELIRGHAERSGRGHSATVTKAVDW